MAGVVEPWAIKTLGDTVSWFVLLLVSVTVTPPTGAGVDNCTPNEVDWPGGTVTPVLTAIPPSRTTSTLSVPLV